MSVNSDTIAQFERARREAFVAADAAALDLLVSDSLIFTHTNGMVEGKASLLKSLGKSVRFLSIDPVEEQIAVYGTAAVVTGELKVSVGLPGQDAIAMRTRITSVWALEAGDWRLTRYQATRFPA